MILETRKQIENDRDIFHKTFPMLNSAMEDQQLNNSQEMNFQIFLNNDFFLNVFFQFPRF